jgi:AraC-like DNA-binding protein
MKVSNPIPCEKISNYVDRVLVIEEVLVTNPFTLPLYANGAPTLTIAQNASKDALLKVQKELYITERTFQRMFEKNIGIAPSLYRRIWQFNNAFQQLNNRRFTKLSDIAFNNGYADQSHYIRAFKEFTGITPKDYLKFGQSE